MRYGLYTKVGQAIIDGLIIGFSLILAYLIRFEAAIPPGYVSQLKMLLPFVVAVRLCTNVLFGLHRSIWRYVGLADAIRMAKSYSAVSTILVLLRVFLPDSLGMFRLPLGVIAIEFSVSLLGALSVRVLRRLLHEGGLPLRTETLRERRVLLVGAGAAGVMTAKELLLRSDRKLVGFLDDNPRKIGGLISGIPVLGPLSALPQVVKHHDIHEVVLCITRAPRDVLKRVWHLCESLQVKTLIIPALEEIFAGEVQVSRLCQVSMENLLAREVADLNRHGPEMKQFYQGRRVLVTGAGGSIGSELARQLAACATERLLLLDKDEHGLHELQLELSARSPISRFEVLVGDVRSSARMSKIFDTFTPDIIFHAAAHKHVPLMELNAAEAVLNNVFATKNLLEQVISFETPVFVLISTDKAVQPSSVMGTTKRLAELLVENNCGRTKSRMLCVRFGNVMSSRGSVIPLFQRQILAGGPVTLTDPEVSRYFMTIPEATQLVLQVGSMSKEAEKVFVLDMGDPIRIVDLARDLIELHGLRPNQDIKIETIGLRPGEKLHEKLIGEGEELAATDDPLILAVTSAQHLDNHVLEDYLHELERAAQLHDDQKVLHLLREFERRLSSGRIVARTR